MRKPSLSLLLLLFLPLLTGCMSAPVARQIASSAFTQTADHITGQVVEAQEQQERSQSRRLTFKDSVSDEYWGIFARAQFQDMPPPQPKEADQPAPPPNTIASRLVPVEIWGFLVGQEKTNVLERMRHNGSETVPNREEWDRWQLATGGLQGKTSAPLYFLVPPDFGRLTSGDHAIVEISGIGSLHVARYRAEN